MSGNKKRKFTATAVTVPLAATTTGPQLTNVVVGKVELANEDFTAWLCAPIEAFYSFPTPDYNAMVEEIETNYFKFVRKQCFTVRPSYFKFSLPLPSDMRVQANFGTIKISRDSIDSSKVDLDDLDTEEYHPHIDV